MRGTGKTTLLKVMSRKVKIMEFNGQPNQTDLNNRRHFIIESFFQTNKNFIT